MPVVWLVFIYLVINETSPLKIGPVGVLLIFILFYALFSSSLFVVAHLGGKLWQLVTHCAMLSVRRMYYVASTLAFGPVFLIALNTLGQLGWIEVVLVVLLVSLGTFYVIRRTAPVS